MTNDDAVTSGAKDRRRHSSINSSLDIGHSSLIGREDQLAAIIPHLESPPRIAVDTEADSLHSYREKLCLVQISVPGHDFIVDPLAKIDFLPLCAALEEKEIVLHGADYDLRLLRRDLNFRPRAVFDTVVAARLLGIKEFSLAALLQKHFGVELAKGSQKADWGQRPLPSRMMEYAMNDTRYLLSLAEKLEAQLKEAGRLEWFHQSCRRALEQAAVDRVRDTEEVWRVSGAGKLRGRTAAVLRALWHWRDSEAQAVDRPPFHILQNRELIESAERFAAGKHADFRHFSQRRRKAFLDAAEAALKLPESEWPVFRKRFGTRPTQETIRRAEDLKERRDKITSELGLEPSFVAPRSTLEAIAADPSAASSLLVPWQRQLLALEG